MKKKSDKKNENKSEKKSKKKINWLILLMVSFIAYVIYRDGLMIVNEFFELIFCGVICIVGLWFFAILIKFCIKITEPFSGYGDRAMNSFQNDVGSGVNSFFSSGGNSDYYRQKQEADKAAYARWYAQDQAKKAEWDYWDDVKRGKDIAARESQNRANYWNNQAR